MITREQISILSPGNEGYAISSMSVVGPFFFSSGDSRFKFCPSIEKGKVESRMDLDLRIKLRDKLPVDL